MFYIKILATKMYKIFLII